MKYSDIRELIPKNKFDIKPVPILMEISESEILPILPDLLFWMADMNWLVAKVRASHFNGQKK
ncbi:MAG: DUF5071 domain-containing protein [Clostridiales bacterium]|jgi:hypothetical protein|nr:DUF5071 domain-containing protein [Clostridiales bacterium]